MVGLSKSTSVLLVVMVLAAVVDVVHGTPVSMLSATSESTVAPANQSGDDDASSGEGTSAPRVEPTYTPFQQNYPFGARYTNTYGGQALGQTMDSGLGSYGNLGYGYERPNALPGHGKFDWRRFGYGSGYGPVYGSGYGTGYGTQGGINGVGASLGVLGNPYGAHSYRSLSYGNPLCFVWP